jgi:hypothetical protein
MGGLCNRMRAVLSYRAAFGEIDVGWFPDGEIAHANWADVFEPLSDVHFESGSDYATITLEPYPHAPLDWWLGYRDVKLLPGVGALFDAARPRVPYSAMHIRRTDHVGLAKMVGNYVPDEEFLAWIPHAISPIYLACDNGTTQLKFMKAIHDAGKECVVADGIRCHDGENENNVRNTSLADAAIDLFVCAGAAEFKPSGASSFSNTILGLRELGGWWT